jgi:hypothetical protein
MKNSTAQRTRKKGAIDMPVYKNSDSGTWYSMCWFTDWQGQRKQKCKRGFLTKRSAQDWEREFLMQKQADVNMTFESFVKLYERDVKPKLKLNTWLTKESIIKKKYCRISGNASFRRSRPRTFWTGKTRSAV